MREMPQKPAENTILFCLYRSFIYFTVILGKLSTFSFEVTINKSICFQRYWHKRWHCTTGKGLPGEVSEAGAVQPGPDHGDLEGQNPVGQRI